MVLSLRRLLSRFLLYSTFRSIDLQGRGFQVVLILRGA